MASVPAAVRPSHAPSRTLHLSSWGGWSSMLRSAAKGQRVTASRHGLLKALSRALRAAGPDTRARPMHALLAGVDFAESRLRGS